MNSIIEKLAQLEQELENPEVVEMVDQH